MEKVKEWCFGQNAVRGKVLNFIFPVTFTNLSRQFKQRGR